MNDNNVMELFFDVSKLLTHYAKMYGQNDKNPLTGQYKCLFILKKAGEISQRRLCELLQIRATSLSELLGKLEKKDMIVRSPSPEDKRTYMVHLTELGQAEVDRIHNEFLKIRNQLVLPLNEDDTKELERLLHLIKEYYINQERK